MTITLAHPAHARTGPCPPRGGELSDPTRTLPVFTTAETTADTLKEIPDDGAPGDDAAPMVALTCPTCPDRFILPATLVGGLIDCPGCGTHGVIDAP